MKVEKRVWTLLIALFLISILLMATGNPIIIWIGIILSILSGLLILLCILGTILI